MQQHVVQIACIALGLLDLFLVGPFLVSLYDSLFQNP